MSVNVKYKDTSIVEMTDTGTKTLKTAGKYCEADIVVENTKDGGSENVEWHQCPELARNYLANVTYDPSDYTTSQIANYAPATAVESNYRPIGVTVGAETYYNQEPNVQTPFANSEKAGTLKPLDQVRWIKTSAANVRDLGGWACDGGTVKYGLLFRGGGIASTARTVLVEELGIMHDLDLRGTTEAAITASPLGDDVYYTCAEQYVMYALTPVDAWKTNLRTIFNAVTHGEPVYFHCSMGCDRTGTIACIVEGLLGVSQSDIDKDYELSSFYAMRARNGSYQGGATWAGLITAINAKSGSTFRDKCVTFTAELGFTADEINAFRAAMIDGSPETITPSISTYTVINSLTNVTTDNSATSATQYQPYTANIAPSAGKIIDSIKVTMGGVDATSQVFSGTEDVLRRSVTPVLTDCSSSNKRLYVIDGQSYVTTITANDGYDMSSVTITMGGVDVSTFYKDGIISIPEVTGDIVITATAVAQAAGYTNLADPTSDDWLTDYRWSSSGTLQAAVGSTVTNFVPIAEGDVIRVKGVDFSSSGAGSNSRTALTVGEAMTGAISTYTYNWNNNTSTNGYMSATYDSSEDVWKFTPIALDGRTYIRWYFPTPSDLSTIIITRNEIID